ncbi:site-specific integrase [Halorubrum ezzemoulense]|uniref:tyrosine-type recombinase/integrase n=1 Tax=Halorubrum ezzemoulense TaxID=337243 RepID=UPI00232DCB84|nr:site-specific integrase [Halorubrum ezzemoulense]MDB2269508.1 site-specific integrase [Halorubrum ezzemoulense]
MSTENDDLERVAEAFDRETDPLQSFESTFQNIDTDPLEAYIDRVLIPNGASEQTLDNYRYSYRQWRDAMYDWGRHPACPSDDHVKWFVRYLREDRGNVGTTIEKKVNNVQRAFEWWQAHQAFPHPADYNPFKIAKDELDLSDDSGLADYPPLDLDELRRVVRDCHHVRDRLFIVWPLKLGIRAGELLNIQIKDITLSNTTIQELYPSLGTADALEAYDDAVYIPPRNERDGNKSHNPRILPLDDEAKRVLLQYLPTRPMVDRPWLILSERTYEPISDSEHVSAIWKEHFEGINSEYQDHRAIRSHYGRNFFTNFWKIQENVPRELVQYMRGDKIGNSTSSEAIDEYLTAYYTDIRELYLDRIFKLG